MPSTTEPYLVLKYVYDTLLGDATLQAMTPAPSVSVGFVATGAAYPRIVVEVPSAAENLNALQDGYSRIWSQPRVQVSVLSENESYDAINAIAARITTLLDGVGAVTVTDGEIVTMSQDWILMGANLEADQYSATIVQQYSTAVVAQ